MFGPKHLWKGKVLSRRGQTKRAASNNKQIFFLFFFFAKAIDTEIEDSPILSFFLSFFLERPACLLAPVENVQFAMAARRQTIQLFGKIEAIKQLAVTNCVFSPFALGCAGACVNLVPASVIIRSITIAEIISNKLCAAFNHFFIGLAPPAFTHTPPPRQKTAPPLVLGSWFSWYFWWRIAVYVAPFEWVQLFHGNRIFFSLARYS